MKKIALAILAMTFAAAGCKNQQEKTAEERQDVAAAQQEGAQNVQEEKKDVAQAQQEAQKDVQEQQKELAQAQQEQAKEAGAMATVSGQVAEASDDSITVKTADGSTLELNVDDKSKITMDGAPATKEQLKNLQEGASVRASYVTEDGDKKAQNIDISGAQPAK